MIIAFILITLLLWWIFFREKIGYLLPNSLFLQYKTTPPKILVLWLLRIGIVVALGLILSGKGYPLVQERTEPIKHHILILLDISRSMLAEDIAPSRIEAAKSTITSFLQERKNDEFGLIVFAGKPFVSIPFSLDTQGIASVLSHITPYYIRQELPGLSGTAIGDALLLANTTLSGSYDTSSVVLLTDGRANVGIDPLVAVEALQEKGVKVFTIAIGGEGSGELSYVDPNTQKRITLLDENGDPLQNDVDETLLRELSNQTNGAMFRAKNAQELYGYWDSISENIGKQTHVVRVVTSHDFRWELFALLLVLIFLERLMTDRIFYKNRR